MKTIIKFTLLCFIAISLQTVAPAAEMQHNFSSPSFNGVGYSSHVLTLKQLEDQAKEKNKAAAEALEAKAKAEAASTPQAQFTANVQSRIYSQLAKQITDTLFGGAGTGCTGSSCAGNVSIGGNNVAWNLSSDGRNINIRIANETNPSQVTNMSVPVGTFYF